MRTILSLSLISWLGSAALLGSIAVAGECPQESSAPLKTRTEIIKGKRVTVIVKDIVICAHPPRPAVAYVTGAKSIDYQQPALEIKLVPKILETVKTGAIK